MIWSRCVVILSFFSVGILIDLPVEHTEQLSVIDLSQYNLLSSYRNFVLFRFLLYYSEGRKQMQNEFEVPKLEQISIP